MENPIKMDDLGVPLFLETTISGQLTLAPKAELMTFWRDSLWCDLGWGRYNMLRTYLTFDLYSSFNYISRP